jgi:hypothetical protein
MVLTVYTFAAIERAQVFLFEHLQLDFWASAKALGDKVRTYTEEKLHEAALEIPAASAKLDEFKATMSDVVTASKELRSHIEHSTRNSLTTEEISEKLSAELTPVLEKFKAEFTLPLPGDQNARYEERARMVDWLMVEVEHTLVRILPIPEADARERFQKIQPHVKHVLLVTGMSSSLYPEASFMSSLGWQVN